MFPMLSQWGELGILSVTAADSPLIKITFEQLSDFLLGNYLSHYVSSILDSKSHALFPTWETQTLFGLPLPLLPPCRQGVSTWLGLEQAGCLSWGGKQEERYQDQREAAAAVCLLPCFRTLAKFLFSGSPQPSCFLPVSGQIKSTPQFCELLRPFW